MLDEMGGLISYRQVFLSLKSATDTSEIIWPILQIRHPIQYSRLTRNIIKRSVGATLCGEYSSPL